jgi:hypothetical protein
MTARERANFTRVVEALVAPVPPLPPASETDATDAFERSLAAGPRLNELALRAAFLLVGAGLRREQLLKLVRSLAHLHYYGDESVMRLLGYDPAAVVARAAEVRRA